MVSRCNIFIGEIMSGENENNKSGVHQALYRKWRPYDFDDVSGQKHITSVLKNEVAENRISHAYLFCGSRGTGKTSCAKILSRAVNCLSPVNGNPCGKCENCIAALNETTTDIVEMDAASNTGVDYIRDIRDAVVYAPSMLKYRVYIIDEVHMLSQSAFNALLKTLEEPPSNVIFILATTEVSKIPVTVISRCQKFDFKRLTVGEIKSRLLYIAEKEGFHLEEDGAALIARLALGGMRDAVSLLDLCSSKNGIIDAECVRSVSGASSRQLLERLTVAVAKSDKQKIFEIIAGIYDSSMDISPFWLELIRFYRDILVCLTSPNSLNSLELLHDEEENLKKISKLFTVNDITYQSRLLDEAYNSIQRGNTDKRLIAEMTLIKMSDARYSDNVDALASRIARLEEELSLIKSGALSICDAVDSSQPNASKASKAKYEKQEDNKIYNDATEKNSESEKNETIENWIEVVDRISRSDITTGAFLTGSYAEKDCKNKKIIIYVDTPFTVIMIKNDSDTVSLIERTVKVVFPDTANYNIEISSQSENKKSDNTIDDIMGGLL